MSLYECKRVYKQTVEQKYTYFTNVKTKIVMRTAKLFVTIHIGHISFGKFEQ